MDSKTYERIGVVLLRRVDAVERSSEELTDGEDGGIGGGVGWEEVDLGREGVGGVKDRLSEDLEMGRELSGDIREVL